MGNTTKTGLTTNNYGKRYGIVSTHLSGPQILADENLIPNSLILSSPTSGNKFDRTGEKSSHSLFFTDYEGNATRLSYTILPGNGLVVNAYEWEWTSTYQPYTVDTLTLEIDHDSLKTTTDKGQLYVSKPDIIDNYTLMVTQELNSPHSYISVITANLEKATDIKFGITRGDNYTISANEGILSVNTENLQYVDDEMNQNGIVRHNPDLPEGEYDWRTIEANNGVLRVLTYNLDRANAETVGVVRPDLLTTSTDIDGTISVLTEGLDKASYEINSDGYGILTYGIVRPDNFTVQIQQDNNGNYIQGVLYANAENMTPTRIENGESHFGVIKLDPVSFGIDTSLCTYVNRYPEIVSLLDRYLEDYSYIMNWLIDHENRITALENQAAAEYIYSFNNYGTNITTLDIPYWDSEAQVVHSEEKYYSVQFSINTNCKFHISVRYTNNVSKPITLHSVRLGDNPVISASGLSQYTFDSTNRSENTLNFTFLCDNYMSSTNEGKTPTTVVLRVSSINDSSIYKEGVHIFDRWNMSKFIQPAPPEPVVEYRERVEEYDIPDGKKKLIFKQVTDTNVNISDYVYTKKITVNQSQLTSATIYIVAKQPMKHIIKKYVDIYKDGVFSSTSEEVNIQTTYYDKYLSVPMYSSAGRINAEQYLEVQGIEYYTRNVSVNESDTGWTQVQENTIANASESVADSQLSSSTNRVTSTDTDWISLSISAIASNTGRSSSKIATSDNSNVTYDSEENENYSSDDSDDSRASSSNSTNIADNTGRQNSSSSANTSLSAASDSVSAAEQYDQNASGYNVLNVMSINPVSTKDRKAIIKLHIANAGNDWDNNSELTINYIEDLIMNDCNISISSVCQNNAEIPLKIIINKTNVVAPISETWKVNIQYCLNTITGAIIKDSENSERINEQYNTAVNTINAATSNTDRGNTTQTQNDSVSLDSASSTENNDSSSRTSVNEQIMSSNSFNKITVTVPASISSFVINFSRSNGVFFDDSSMNDINDITNVIPQSVFNILTSLSSRDVENTISGFTIVNATVEGFSSETSTTWSSQGSWSTNIVDNQNYISFGNASITNVTIKPWDDTRMQFEFMLRPGSTTKIPVGSMLSVTMTNGILPNCILYNGNVSHKYTDYYDNIIIANDGWTATGCKVTMILNNTIPVAPDPNSVSHTQLFTEQAQEEPVMRDINNSVDYNEVIGSSVQTMVYTNDRGNTTEYISTTSNLIGNTENGGKGSTGTDGLSLTEHQVLNANYPVLQSITGFKFNFMLTAQSSSKTNSTSTSVSVSASTVTSNTSIMDFAVSLSNLSDKINVNANYSSGASKDINIVNALYSNNTSNMVSAAEETESDKIDSYSQLAEEVESLKETLNNLGITTTTTTTGGADYQPLVGGGKINAGDSTTMYSSTTYYGQEYTPGQGTTGGIQYNSAGQVVEDEHNGNWW